MKRCSKCLTIKDLSSFGGHNTSKDGKRSKCLKCNEKPIYLKKENRKIIAKRYRKGNGAWVRRAWCANRRALLKQATPKWLTEDQKLHIKQYYELAALMMTSVDQKLDIDHIIPISGKNVCGLHVPWNLQVMAHEANMSKSNKVLP